MPATEIELAFGDGDYLFALKLPQVLELQRLCGAGIFTIYGRVLKGRYLLNDGAALADPRECEAFIGDVYETVRLGLIGGGQGMVSGEEVTVSPLRAKQLIETYAHPAPLKDAWEIAAAILFAKIEGYTPKKKAPAPDAEEPLTVLTKRKSSPTAR